MTFVFLTLAIVAEVMATSALKASMGFTRPLPSLLVVIGYGVAFYLLSLVLRTLPGGYSLCHLGGPWHCAGYSGGYGGLRRKA